MKELITKQVMSVDICPGTPDNINIVFPQVKHDFNLISRDDIVDANITSHSTMYKDGVGYITTYIWRVSFYVYKEYTGECSEDD